MPRAHRHYIPGCVWHITHRCHRKEFLLKFEKDRKRWCYWLFEAKKRYGLCVLDYIVTSNHIHLLVVDTGKESIPKSLQLVAGRTAQEYNLRKNRKGAFWEDRYHATAIQSDEHLVQCLVYIDLNMVRAGVVKHPSEYTISGYKEIQNPPKRYSILDREKMLDLFGVSEEKRFQQNHREWVDVALQNGKPLKNSNWSESVAVGSESFVNDIRRKLARRAKGRSVVSSNGINTLKEPQSPYDTLFDMKKRFLRPENMFFVG